MGLFGSINRSRNGRRVVPQKGPPSLTCRPESRGHVLVDIGLHQLKSELEQFASNLAAPLT